MSKLPECVATFFKTWRSILVGHLRLQSVSYWVETPCRPVVPGGAGGTMAPPDFFADQLTLSQPGGADYAHHITYWHPRIFRPSYGPACSTYIYIKLCWLVKINHAKKKYIYFFQIMLWPWLVIKKGCPVWWHKSHRCIKVLPQRTQCQRTTAPVPPMYNGAFWRFSIQDFFSTSI